MLLRFIYNSVLVKMNKLKKIVFIKKDWGSEIIWGQTDKYTAKTIELKPHSNTPIFLTTRRDKNIIVVDGEFFLMYGNCCDDKPLKTYKLPVGWSWYIEPKKLHQYSTLDKGARIIEVSSYEPEIDELVFDNKDIEDEQRIVVKQKVEKVSTKKKRGRPVGSKNKKKKI